MWEARGKLDQLDYRLSQGLPRAQVWRVEACPKTMRQKEGDAPRSPGAITNLHRWEVSASVHWTPLCRPPAGSPWATRPLC